MIALNDGVHAAQRTFRTLLHALAYPGRLAAVVDPFPGAPFPFSPASAAAAQTLFDRDVTVWLGAPSDPVAAAWLTESTGARIVDDPRLAQFAVLRDAVDVGVLAEFSSGTAEDPETSATAFVHVDALSGGAPVVLRGPGIDGEIVFAPRGVPPHFWATWSQNTVRFPLGVDCFFFDAHAVAGLPRTVKGRPA